jgi:hypothetical protein
LRNQGESSNPNTYAPGGVIPGEVQYRISPAESIITAADVRRMFRTCFPERLPWPVPESLPRLQGEVMYGFAVPSPAPLYTYDNLSPEVIKHTMRLAAERDDRFNAEETRVYNDTNIELEFGSGFLLRAHP